MHGFGSSGRLSGQLRPMYVRHSVNTYFTWRDISVLSGSISVKLAPNIHHLSDNCWKGFQGQRSKVKFISRPNALFPQTDSLNIGVARIFSAGMHFLLHQISDLFSHQPLLHGHIRHILPPTTFLSHLRGCTSPKIQPHFSLIPTKIPRKKILLCRPGGVHLHPLHSDGYACG